MLAFHADERREAMLTYVIDLYAGDLGLAPNAVRWGCLVRPQRLLRAGAPRTPKRTGSRGPAGRRVRRFALAVREHIPFGKRRIDRISLFKAKPDCGFCRLTLSETVANTFACKWHHNLMPRSVPSEPQRRCDTNPGSRHAIQTFAGRTRSVPLAQPTVMDLGLMEPGQWF